MARERKGAGTPDAREPEERGIWGSVFTSAEGVGAVVVWVLLILIVAAVAAFGFMVGIGTLGGILGVVGSPSGLASDVSDFLTSGLGRAALASVTLAVMMTAVIIAARDAVRMYRGDYLKEFMNSFGVKESQNPSIAFAVNKYDSTDAVTGATREEPTPSEPPKQTERGETERGETEGGEAKAAKAPKPAQPVTPPATPPTVTPTTPRAQPGRRLIIAAIPFVILSAGGFFLALAPKTDLLGDGCPGAAYCAEVEKGNTKGTITASPSDEPGPDSQVNVDDRAAPLAFRLFALAPTLFATGGDNPPISYSCDAVLTLSAGELRLSETEHGLLKTRCQATSSPSLTSLESYDTHKARLVGELGNVLTIAVFAFLGAYLFAITTLLRAIMSFELSQIDFLRVAGNMLLSVVVAVVLYRAWPTGDILNMGETAAALVIGGVGAVVGGAAGAAAPEGGLKEDPKPAVVGAVTAGAAGASLTLAAGDLNAIWIGVAFLCGLFPDLGLRRLVSILPFAVKGRRDDLVAASAAVPLEVIDGIDFWRAYRLEENNISDIQNLATANPVLIHVETPFGFYEACDWVGQAQLCSAVGPARFVELRRRGIRNLFDLEAAISPAKGQQGAPLAPIVLKIFQHAPAGGEKNASARFDTPLLAFAAAAAGDDARRDPVTGDMTDAGLVALVANAMKNPHVVRLRTLRELILEQLGNDAPKTPREAKPAS